MSIIHDALRRRTLKPLPAAEGAVQPVTPPQKPIFHQAVLVGAAGAAAIALTIYSTSRQPDINVFNVTPASTPPSAPSTRAEPNDFPILTAAPSTDIPYVFDYSAAPANPTIPGIAGYDFIPVDQSDFPSEPVIIPVRPLSTSASPAVPAVSLAPQGEKSQVPIILPSTQMAAAPAVVEPRQPQAAAAPVIPTGPTPPAAGITVARPLPDEKSLAPTITAARPSQIPAMLGELPEGTVTIEMADVGLESLTGSVDVDGRAPQPGARIRVGSTITTGSGEASLAFARASVDVRPHTVARINRLERHEDKGLKKEEVTVDLQKGELSTVIHPGQGSVLISTPEIIASTNSGAFTVKANPDQSITVTSIGGLVKVVPLKNRQETYIVKGNESVTFRNGKAR